ncbi:DUF3857 domain-containing protein [Winogradskyella sp.]|jgi:hypothetical protein|uniref:DUF3857 domain-containing protein n=1 Tax=Winogradskyella sp. TaxID=1883156 RepID=UPI0025D2A34F|nr:DUF3857 domain-containing protein [Winogradskyella sp.]MCT4631049.1 DUF3857 domain-containing protein [Winogradskyella sp.]
MPNIKYTISALLFFISFFTLAQNDYIYSSKTIPKNLTGKANAVVRYNEINVVIESKDELSIIEKRVVTVLNEKGVSAIGAYSGYDRYNKIKKIEAKVFNDNGEEIKKFKKKDFIDRSAVDGGTLYSDSRLLLMGYTPVSYPFTVEFLCEIESSNTAAIPTWRPINNYYVSVQKDSYNLIDNANLGLRYKEKNFDEYNITKKNTSHSLSYTLENSNSLLNEDLSPTYNSLFPQVLIAVENFSFYGVEGKAKNWLEFGEWINNALLEGRNEVMEETKEEILKLTDTYIDPLEKAKVVFKFVQENTRYISVQVGIGGVQPISALEVDELKYGDCKGLTNYTKSLLDVVGVTSYYTIVEAGRAIIDLEDDFASLEQGNHIILAIPTNDDMVWLDCTSQQHPFNFIGDFTDNRNVLVVKPNASKIVKTKVYIDSLNYQTTNANIKLEANGGFASKIIRKTSGLQYDNRFNLERKTNDEVIKFYKYHWSYINNLKILQYKFHNNKNDIEFTEYLDVKADSYASILDKNILFKPNFLNQNSFIPTRYRERKMPFEISRGYLDEDLFNIEIPEGYEIEALPDIVYIKSEFGEYKLELSSNDNLITYKRKLFIKKGQYSRTDYKSYRDFRKQISKGDNSKIVLKLIN